MKIKLHSLFKKQLDSLGSSSVGIIWFIVEQSNGRLVLEKQAVSTKTVNADIERMFQSNQYQFVSMTERVPLFKKL